MGQTVFAMAVTIINGHTKTNRNTYLLTGEALITELQLRNKVCGGICHHSHRLCYPCSRRNRDVYNFKHIAGNGLFGFSKRDAASSNRGFVSRSLRGIIKPVLSSSILEKIINLIVERSLGIGASCRQLRDIDNRET